MPTNELKSQALREHDVKALQDLLENFKKEAMNLRFQHKLSPGDFNLQRFRIVKTQIARIMTLINEKVKFSKQKSND